MSEPVFDAREVRDSLERILRHPDFVSAPRLAAFLRFVVTETLEGRASRVKAYLIATSVFGRGESFDPQTNPVVRVEAMRLRQALAHYYETAGAGDPLQIRMGRGSYVPEFVRGPTAQEETATVAVPVLATSQKRTSIAWAAVAAFIAMAASVTWLALRSPPPPGSAAVQAPSIRPMTTGQAPTITVKAIAATADPLVEDFTGILGHQLETALSRFEYPQVVQQGGTPALYLLSAFVRPVGANSAVIDIKLIHAASSTILWAREFDKIAIDPGSNGTIAFSGEVAAQVGRTYGVVFSDMRKRIGALDATVNGFDCVIFASAALSQGDDEPRRRAQQCLQRTLATEPDLAPALIALAYLDVARYLDGASTDLTAKAIEPALGYAGQAVARTPYKSRAHAALFWTRFISGRFDDAFESAQTALELNPYALDTRARIGAAHMLRGRTEQGAAMMKEATVGSGWSPGWHEFFLFLDAHLKGDDIRAARHAGRKNALSSPLGHLARIIVANKENNIARVQSARQDLQTQFPGFAADIPAALDRYAMIPQLRDRLLADLGESPSRAKPATPIER